MLVVEKYLDVLHGHENTQVAAIQRIVSGRPLTFITGRQCESTFDEASTVLTVLSSREDIKESPKQAVDHDLVAMQAVLSSSKMLREPILYVNAQTHDLRVALRLVSELALSHKIYMRVLVEREIVQLTYDECAALKAAVIADRITLLTETDSLANHFRTCYDLKVHETAICLPCSVIPGQSLNLPSVARSQTHRFRVGFLGGWRAEKGVDMLPQFLLHLRKALDAADNKPEVEVIIQKPITRETFKRIKKSIRSHYPFWQSIAFSIIDKRLSISFRKTELTKEDFFATLMSIDILLVPYRLDDYRYRGSGIILDGVVARKPIVYTNGMGMTEFLTFGNAEPAFEDPKDYADKVMIVMSKIQLYKTAADQAVLELDRRIEQSALFLRSI